jgi:TPR repeat protein
MRKQDERNLLLAAEDGDLRAILLVAQEFTRKCLFEQAEPWARAAAEAGGSEGIFCLGAVYEGMAALGGPDSARLREQARRSYTKAAESGHVDAMYTLAHFSDLSAGERERWMVRGATAGHRWLRRDLLRRLRQQQRLAEAEPWQRAAAEAGDQDEQLALAERLVAQGHVDEAAYWFQAAAGGEWLSVSQVAAEQLAHLLTNHGREDEAARWHDRARELARESEKWLTEEQLRAGDVGTVALTALVTTAVLPFVQALVSKAAEDAYGQARELVRRLVHRDRSANSASGPSRESEALFTIVEDPDAGISLHLWSDVSDDALQALAAFDLNELTARRPDQGRIRVVWDQASGTWRIRGE